MNENKNHRGITLVALVITVIVMLILVGVTINIAINGGLFDITKKVAKQTEIAAYKEKIDAARINIMAEQISKGLTGKEFMDRYEEALREDKNFEGSTITRKDELTIVLITKEGYEFTIKEEATEEVKEPEKPTDLNKSNTTFTYSTDTWTKGIVKIKIETKVEGYTLQYSTDNINWENYTSEIEISKNGKVYARLKDEAGRVGVAATVNVTIIDKLLPNKFKVTGTNAGNTITLTGSTTDQPATNEYGMSGIKAYYYSKDGGSTWEPEEGTTETSYTFKNLEDGKTYTMLKMKAVDNAGNETVTDSISVSIEAIPKAKVGDYVDYKPDEVDSSYTLETQYSGYSPNQSITQDPLNWQILKIYEDGRIDLIGTPTSQDVYFKEAIGYNNGVYLMNDICNTFYSKTLEDGSRIEARSIRIEDLEDEENGGDWKKARTNWSENIIGVNTGRKYGETRTCTGNLSYYPNIYAQENGSGINTTKVKTDGINRSDIGYTSLTKETSSQARSGLTITQTFYYVDINKTNYGEVAKVLNHSNGYWIASRCVYGYGNDYINYDFFKASGRRTFWRISFSGY